MTTPRPPAPGAKGSRVAKGPWIAKVAKRREGRERIVIQRGIPFASFALFRVFRDPRPLAVALLLAACVNPPAPTPVPTPTPIPVPSVIIMAADGRQVVVPVEVADTPETKTRGLSRRERLDEAAGMIFVFDEPGLYNFWMADTTIPLSIAFIARDGRIVDVKDMEPLSRELHTASAPYQYALEVNRGFFARQGIKPGDRVELHLSRQAGGPN